MASSTPAAPSVLFRGVGGGREAGGGDGGPEAGSLFAGQPPSARPARGLDLGAGSPFVQVRRLGRALPAGSRRAPSVRPALDLASVPDGSSWSSRSRTAVGSIAIYRRPRPWSWRSKPSWARAPGARKTAPQWAVLGDDRPPRSLLLLGGGFGLHRGPKGPREKEQGTDARPRRPGLPRAPAGTRSPRPRTSRARRGSGRGTWRPQRRRRGPPCPPRCAAPRRRRCPPRRSRHSGTGSPAARAPGPPPRRRRPARPRPSRRQAGRSRAGSRR